LQFLKPFLQFLMISALGQNDRYICYISAIWEAIMHYCQNGTVMMSCDEAASCATFTGGQADQQQFGLLKYIMSSLICENSKFLSRSGPDHLPY